MYMTNGQDRRLRIQKTLEVIKGVCEREDVCIEERLFAMMDFDWGISRKTAREYIKTLILSGRVKKEGENLIWVEYG